MKIDFVRTGGFAAIRLATSIDTENLAPERAAEVEKLVSDARFYQLPHSNTAAAPVPDSFQYRLRISAASRAAHEILVDDQSMPASLLPLVDFLTKFALDKPTSSDQGASPS